MTTDLKKNIKDELKALKRPEEKNNETDPVPF
jgi:hypothetical protein